MKNRDHECMNTQIDNLESTDTHDHGSEFSPMKGTWDENRKAINARELMIRNSPISAMQIMTTRDSIELVVFAKKGTDEKALIALPKRAIQSEVADMQKRLMSKYGGEWLRVDELELHETLIFTDGMIYQGYKPGTTRYFAEPVII